MPDGQMVDMYTLSNINGIKVNIITHRGAVRSIDVPNNNGHIQDVALAFPKPTAIGARIHENNQRLRYAKPKPDGCDFNDVLDNPGNPDALAVRVTNPKSGRTLDMHTNKPGAQFYTSNFLHHVKGKGDKIYEHWGAFTLEAQHFPDSPNEPAFPPTELKPGQKYTQTTIYRFLPE